MGRTEPDSESGEKVKVLLRGKELKLEDAQASHTLGGASYTAMHIDLDLAEIARSRESQKKNFVFPR